MDAVFDNETNYIAWNSSIDLYSNCTQDATETSNLVCLCRNSAYVITFEIGVFGNILVCIAVCRNKDRQTITNMFIVNTAVADWSVVLVMLPSSLVVDITDTWLFGGAFCKISIAIGK
ncbi:OX1R-like protein [Mya arenaria]|uniref:OX1R-like protein n=1 Tax=Mya arenaria TaxID=6604 RepID=A0ABY7G5Q0_MYAAR|nr:OX1R-like protein [Mya arenaria]